MQKVRQMIVALVAMGMTAAFGMNVQEKGVEVGVWTSDWAAAKALASSAHIPMVVFWGNFDCHVCEATEEAISANNVVQWQKERDYIFVFAEGTDTATTAEVKKFCKTANGKGKKLSDFPYVCLWWEKEDGTTVAVNFSGTDDGMPGAGANLAEKFMNSVEASFSSYTGREMAYFAVSGAAKDRLEAVKGVTTQVYVPMKRYESGRAWAQNLNYGAGSVAVNWAEGETYKEIAIPVDASLTEGGAMTLKLLDSKNNEVAITYIYIVGAASNEVSNPQWEGAEYGKWTMDWAAAKDLAKNNGKPRIAVFSGTMWCPYCIGIETSFFVTQAFKDWAVANDVVLTIYDQARAGKDGPRLMNYEPDPNKSGADATSGAWYLSRNGISKAQADAAINTITQFSTVTWLAPESTAARLGNPTILLINDDDTVAARFSAWRDASKNYDVTENIARFTEFINMVGASEQNNYITTTTNILTIGKAKDVLFQINDKTECFKLNGVSAGRITFKVANAVQPVTLSLLRDGVEFAKGTGELSVTLERADVQGVWALKASTYSGSVKYASAGSTLFTATISSSIILLPKEYRQTVAVVGASVNVEIGGLGTKEYKFEGIDETALLQYFTKNAEGDCWVIKDDSKRVVSLAVATGVQEVAYQNWHPGEVAFNVLSASAFKFGKGLDIEVTRKNGSSDAIAINVIVAGGTAKNGERYIWDDNTVITWEDGEEGTKRVHMDFVKDSSFVPDQTVELQLVAQGICYDNVSADKMVITIKDTDKATLGQTEYKLCLYTGFGASFVDGAQEVYNNEGSVKIVLDRKLPSGLRLVYDKKASTVNFSGSAKSVSSAQLQLALKDKRGVGDAIALNIEVIDPATLNEWVVKPFKVTVPLFAKNVMVGFAEVSQTKKGKLTVKCANLKDMKKASFSGLWSSLDEENGAVMVLNKRNNEVVMRLSAKGELTVVYGGGEGTVQVCEGDYEEYDGAYSVALVDEQLLGAAMSLTVKKGKARYQVTLSDGKKLSGNSLLAGMAQSNEFAVVTIAKKSGSNILGAALQLRNKAAEAASRRAVVTLNGTQSVWKDGEKEVPLLAYGSYIDATKAIADEAGLDEFALKVDAEGMNLKETGFAERFVAQDKKFVFEKVSGFSFKYVPKTGVYTGKTKLLFANAEKAIKATFAGVVLPGWYDCGCNDEPDDDNVIPKPSAQFPFGCGAIWWTEKVNGRSTKRAMPLTLEGIE